MATWSVLATVTETYGVKQPAYLDNKIYFIDSQNYIATGTPTLNPGGDIYELDPSSPSQTMILDASSFASGTVYVVWSLASFGGDLYASIEIETDPDIETSPRVYRWDGGTSWTQVFSTSEANAQYAKYNRLYAQDDVMVLFIRGQGDDNGFLWYTASGSSWNAGTAGSMAGGVGTELEHDFTVYWPLGIYELICVTDSGSTCTDSDIKDFDGSAWASFQTSPADVYLQSSPNGNCHFGGGGFYKLSADMSTADLLDSNIGALMLMNAIDAQIGADGQTTQTVLYQFDGATSWVELETMSTSSSIDPDFGAASGWIANGTANAWLLGKNTSTGNWELWERSANFPASDADYVYTHATGGIPGAVLEAPA